MASSAPARRPRTSAAHSTSSSRLMGKKRAFGVAPRQCPDRPARCNATWSAPGLPSWATRSTVPMSMPSSSDAVATMARREPALSRSSASSRRARDRLPWWAATCPSPSRSESAWAARSASLRVFTNTRVVRFSPGELREPVVGLGPLLLGGHRGELVPRDLHAQVEDAPAPHLDDGALRGRRDAPARRPPGSGPPPRPGSPWPRGRCAGGGACRAPRAARARGRGGCRACRGPRRGSRRRSPCGPGRATGAPSRS